MNRGPAQSLPTTKVGTFTIGENIHERINGVRLDLI